MKAGLINPTNNITNQVRFKEVKDEFGNWPDPKNGW